MRGVRGNGTFLLLKNTKCFEKYFDIKWIYFTSTIIGFYEHLDNLKKKIVVERGQLKKIHAVSLELLSSCIVCNF